ncbi:hypothetical protein UFOVP595_44 [uncultured Caudovirales phage]|uniref:Uncharacterized protein n=1 Tax=uncultured Caudovirales phage TaxID=2100421 RepID=A0A6J5N427_9CAUD|nr:hypothetical protein UFOVP595_44 [uncultured Caudovirales phage]
MHETLLKLHAIIPKMGTMQHEKTYKDLFKIFWI